MISHGRKMTLALLVLLCGASAARAGTAEALNRVTSVEALDAQGKLAIHGTERPSFTVFKLAEPSRLVIDLAGADVTAVAPGIDLKSGAVKGVTAAQFDEAGRRVGRLVVVLDGDAHYDVKAAGNDLLVTVAAEHAATTAPVASPLNTSPAGETNAAGVESASTASAEASNSAPTDPNLVVQREDSRTVKHAAHKLSGVSVQEAHGQARVRLSTDGQIAHFSVIELKDPARLAVDLHGVSGVTRKLDGKGDLKGVRIARHEDGTRVVLDGQGDRMPAYDVQRRADGLDVVVGSAVVAANHPTPLAPSEAQPLTVASVPPAKPTVKLEAKQVLANIRSVDLDSSVEHTQVAIAIDGAFKFEVGHPNPKTVVLTISDANLPERLERNLDATALGGALDMVSAYRVPSMPGVVKIIASLHAPCKDEISAHMGGLSWKFGADPVFAQQPAVSIPARAAAATTEPASASPQPSVLDDRNYTGRRVDFNVKDIDIRNLLGAIADISKKNIILADDVKGTVTIRLRNVPWDQALDIILKSKGLGKEEISNIIRVAPIERLRQEQKDAADAAKVKQTYEPLKVRLIPVNNATAAQLVDKIKDSLTERGTVSVDARTNTLIIKDVQDSLLRAEGIIRNLDTQTPEVLIESRIVEASVNFTRAAGIQWGGNVSLSPATGNSTGLVFPNILQVAGAADDSTAPIGGLSNVTQPNFAVNMPAAIGVNSGGGLGFVLGSAGGAAQLNLRLSAAENSGTLKTISSPRIQTLDNVEASIGQGVQIPFSQVSASGVNTQFIEAKLELRVTPHVTQEGSIQMKISATNNQPNAQLTGANGQPAISNREAKTQVLVKDSDTAVIGGIYTRQNSESWNEVPVLSRIPILGWLFKKKQVSDQRTELLIFITPHIINRSESTLSTSSDEPKQ